MRELYLEEKKKFEKVKKKEKKSKSKSNQIV